MSSVAYTSPKLWPHTKMSLMTTSLSDQANFQPSIDDRSKSKHPTGPRLVAFEGAPQVGLKELKINFLTPLVQPRRPRTCSRGSPPICQGWGWGKSDIDWYFFFKLITWPFRHYQAVWVRYWTTSKKIVWILHPQPELWLSRYLRSRRWVGRPGFWAWRLCWSSSFFKSNSLRDLAGHHESLSAI